LVFFNLLELLLSIGVIGKGSLGTGYWILDKDVFKLLGKSIVSIFWIVYFGFSIETAECSGKAPETFLKISKELFRGHSKLAEVTCLSPKNNTHCASEAQCISPQKCRVKNLGHFSGGKNKLAKKVHEEGNHYVPVPKSLIPSYPSPQVFVALDQPQDSSLKKVSATPCDKNNEAAIRAVTDKINKRIQEKEDLNKISSTVTKNTTDDI
jgi:hypothetical protein